MTYILQELHHYEWTGEQAILQATERKMIFNTFCNGVLHRQDTIVLYIRFQ